MHGDVDAARAARREEARQLLHARRGIQAQRLQVGVENAQLAPGRGEQPVERVLEIGFRFELLILRLRPCLAHGARSRCTAPCRYQP